MHPGNAMNMSTLCPVTAHLCPSVFYVPGDLDFYSSYIYGVQRLACCFFSSTLGGVGGVALWEEACHCADLGV